MRIRDIETYVVGAGWKNYVFVRVLTDEGLHGIGEATLNGFPQTCATAVEELKHLAVGENPFRVRALARRLLDSVSNDGGHVHRAAIAGIEVACWDILGKSHGVPIYSLLGGAVRDSVRGYANGWYRSEQTPEAIADAADRAISRGFNALKLDPLGTAAGVLTNDELRHGRAILAGLRDRVGAHVDILVDMHARLVPSEAARFINACGDLGIYWWEEPTTREREDPACDVARLTGAPIATGEAFDAVGQFFTLARGGNVGIWQPEPMSLGGIGPTLAVANLAAGAGAVIAPHQSGGPVATAVCLQVAACTENFLIQEHFDTFNDPWTRDLVTWAPTLNRSNGHLSLPVGPGLGLDLNLAVVREHPYDPHAYLNTAKAGWQLRLGTAAASAGSGQ